MVCSPETDNPHKENAVKQQIIVDYLQVNIRSVEYLISDFKHKKVFTDTGFRPCKVDAEGLTSLKHEVLKRKDELKPITKSEFPIAVHRVARETNIRNGGTGLNVTVWKNTCDKIFDDIDASAEIGQTTTKARYRESKDIRNFVSMGVMNEAYALYKPPQMIGNYDATQFVVSLKNQELLITIKREYLNGSCDDGNLPLTNVEDSPLDFGIKWMMTANAIGHLGMDVFLVNDPHMDADAISLYEITGLTHRSDPKASGWLVFCKTRWGIPAFSSGTQRR
jgi:hypothetical protein